MGNKKNKRKKKIWHNMRIWTHTFDLKLDCVVKRSINLLTDNLFILNTVLCCFHESSNITYNRVKFNFLNVIYKMILFLKILFLKPSLQHSSGRILKSILELTMKSFLLKGHVTSKDSFFNDTRSFGYWIFNFLNDFVLYFTRQIDIHFSYLKNCIKVCAVICKWWWALYKNMLLSYIVSVEQGEKEENK